MYMYKQTEISNITRMKSPTYATSMFTPRAYTYSMPSFLYKIFIP